MGCPYESFGDNGVALIADLESAVVHEPRQGLFHDTSSWKHIEAVIMDPVHHLSGDVVGTTRGDEGLLEATVAPDLLQARGSAPCPVDHSDASCVVQHVSGYNSYSNEESESVDHAEGLASGDLLSSVISPGGTDYRRPASDASGVDDPSRGLDVSTFSFPHLVMQSFTDSLPDAALRPTHMVAVHGVSVQVVGRQRSLLTTRGRYVEDSVHDVPLIPLGGSTHPTASRVGGDQISY